jgi:hypothetical protein
VPYFERSPSLVSVNREQRWRVQPIERTTHESVTQTFIFVPDFAGGATRIIDNISTNNAVYDNNVLSTTVASSEGGFIEVYARLNADAAGSGNQMAMQISIDGIVQGTYFELVESGVN